MRAYRGAIVILFGFILVTALSLVYVKHRSRTLVTEMEQLTRANELLDEEWGRLLLEQSVSLSHGKVEQIATERLKMEKPNSQQIVVIK